MASEPIRLPHSGLVVPHTGYTVTSIKGRRQTHDGLAFTATLRLHNKIIGRIENDGRGGPDTLYSTPADGYRRQAAAMKAFAQQCKDASGRTPSLETLLGDLVTEHETTRRITRAAKRGNVLIRMMGDFTVGDSPLGWPGPEAWTETSPALADDHDKLRAVLLNDPELAPHALAWWQIWNADAGCWIDVTSRPAHLPADPA